MGNEEGKIMKRAVYVALVSMFLLAGMVSVVSAATTNAEFKASLVIYPKILATDTVDTVVTLGNDSNSVDVFVHCEWMDENQNAKDFEFTLTAGEIGWFLASTGFGSKGVDQFPPVPFVPTIGSLTCFATDQADDLPIQHNHLFGTATIYDFANGLGVGYNAYGFRRLIPKGVIPAADPVLSLNNVEYDACPAYLLGTFMFTGASFDAFDDPGYTVEAVTTDLTLYSCEQDMKQDPTPTYSKARFTIFDENEGRSTNTTICFKCWMEVTLDSRPSPYYVASAGVGTATNWGRWMFNPSNGFTFGYFRVQGVNSTSPEACGLAGPIQATPVIGTLFRTVSFVDAGDLVMTGGVLQSTNTSDTTGFILYDQASGGDVESNNR